MTGRATFIMGYGICLSDLKWYGIQYLILISSLMVDKNNIQISHFYQVSDL